MSILQELEQIRKRIGEETYKEIEEFLEYHPHYLLSDVYYMESVWKEFEEWRNLNKAIEIVARIFNDSTSFSYPYTETYAEALREVIEAAKKSQDKCVDKKSDKARPEICGMFFNHGNKDDYELWCEFSLTKEDEDAIYKILEKYETFGNSVRGKRNEIVDMMNGTYVWNNSDITEE